MSSRCSICPGSVDVRDWARDAGEKDKKKTGAIGAAAMAGALATAAGAGESKPYRRPGRVDRSVLLGTVAETPL